MKQRLEYLLKHNLWIMQIFIILGSSFFKFCGLFIKIDNKLILFNSFSGKQYNDSPKAIYEYLRSLPEGDKFRYVWAFEEPDRFEPFECETVKIDSWKYFMTALKAKYWVASVNIERGLKFKKKKTLYLNTWHGPAINLMGNAVEGRNDFKWDHVDFFCTSGEYERKIICHDFCVKPENILMSGLPRNDALYYVTDDKMTEIKIKLGIPTDKKVILYAPTWREGTGGDYTCSLIPPINIDKWKKQFNSGYVLIIRAHVNTRKMLGIEFDEVVRDASNYPIVNDLLSIADYLISDYSSIIMDYSILGRPIVCFGYDYEAYKIARGGFYFDLEKEIPSGVCRTEDEVLSYILKSNYEQECKKAEAFRDRHIEVGGKATIICSEKILECAAGLGGKRK